MTDFSTTCFNQIFGHSKKKYKVALNVDNLKRVLCNNVGGMAQLRHVESQTSAE